MIRGYCSFPCFASAGSDQSSTPLPSASRSTSSSGPKATALTGAGRFTVNSTLGVGGLLDVAAKWGGLEKQTGDFGQTLFVWGLPEGPYLVTPDEVGDAADLEVRCEVDGAVMQQSRTSDLLFSPAQIVSYASQTITLRPGDLIATGTCGGVGDARKPPVYLQPGNLLRTWIEGLGECLNQCVPEKTG